MRLTYQMTQTEKKLALKELTSQQGSEEGRAGEDTKVMGWEERAGPSGLSFE